MAPQKANAKPVVKLDSPYTSPIWWGTPWPVFHPQPSDPYSRPRVSESDQELFDQLLLSLLSPIGHFRATHVSPSKGKRIRRKQRRPHPSGASNADSRGLGLGQSPDKTDTNPRLPKVREYVTVGFNSTVRHLESLSSQNISQISSGHSGRHQGKPLRSDVAGNVCMPRHLAVIFILQSFSDLPRAQLPILARAASLAHPALPPTILVPLNTTSQAQVAKALSQPRAGVLGIMEEAPGANTLTALVRERVPTVQVPWLEEAIAGKYLGMKWHSEADNERDPPELPGQGQLESSSTAEF